MIIRLCFHKAASSLYNNERCSLREASQLLLFILKTDIVHSVWTYDFCLVDNKTYGEKVRFTLEERPV